MTPMMLLKLIFNGSVRRRVCFKHQLEFLQSRLAHLFQARFIGSRQSKACPHSEHSDTVFHSREISELRAGSSRDELVSSRCAYQHTKVESGVLV